MQLAVVSHVKLCPVYDSKVVKSEDEQIKNFNRRPVERFLYVEFFLLLCFAYKWLGLMYVGDVASY